MENNQQKQLVLLKAKSAKEASKKLAIMNTEQKNNILLAMAFAIEKNIKEILFHNEIDVQAAKEAGINNTLIDRLTLNEKRINEMAKSIKDIVLLQDPIGSLVEEISTSANNIDVKKIRVSLGVVAMIYEARPNVTVDATALCLKAGNSIILKGGSEAINSNSILIKIISEAAVSIGMPEGAIQFIDTTDRSAVQELIHLDNLIDLLIPRGSNDLIQFIKAHSLIPVLSHGTGLCHTYIDESADIDMAIRIALNAKCQRPFVCNSIETLLVHKNIAEKVLPELCKLYTEAGVEIRGCSITKNIIPSVKDAQKEDWSTEYLDLKISIKIVNSLEEAIEHINEYGSKHSEAIITSDREKANKFIAEIDAAAVFVNASTRLHDGGVLGLGCEIGISTQKLHARGAMGLKELTTTKYVVQGSGAIRN
ncbi:MAG: glutamate-5-semialdehyde dehydrogenase [Endomicrobium sp.]|jgi:glutamate-5-semialdehyde dehydrogenase|nr:glutamate-5-semialdehyde dehydrogenase [Endomicrobium sp.]